MISNKDRSYINDQLDNLAIKEPPDFESIVALIKNRESLLLQKDPLLLEDLYLLANFCRLFPNQEVTKTVLAAISIACEADMHSKLRRFAVRSVYHSCLHATSNIQLDSVSSEESDWLEGYLHEIDIKDEVKTLCNHAEDILHKLRDRALFGPKNLIRNLLFIKKHIILDRNQFRGYSKEGLLALKALQYLHDSDDLIPDQHGYLGLLDDKEVINHAIYHMAPSLEKLDRLEASLKGHFKNLCQLQFSQGGERYKPFKKRGEVSAYTPSGYLLATTSPLLNKVLHPEQQQNHIIITDASVVHCLLASLITTIASFEIDCANLKLPEEKEANLLPELGTLVSLEDGTKCRFNGIEVIEDQKMVVLEVYVKRNQSRRLIYKPVEQFRNWSTTNADGKFRRDARGNYDLNFAEICHDFERFDYSQVKTSQNIFLVCKNQILEDQLDGVTINGHNWKSVVPTARVTRNLTLDSDVGAHEITGNKLFLVNSLGLLTSFLFEENGLKNCHQAIVIVEGSEAANESDELLTLHALGLSTFIFCNETVSAASLNQLIEVGFNAFKWDKGVTDLLPPTGFPSTPTSLITSWEYQLFASKSLKIMSIPVQSPSAEEIFESLKKLDELERLQSYELSDYEVDAIRDLKRLALKITRADSPKDERTEFISKLLGSVNEQKSLIVEDRRLRPLLRETLDAFCTTLSSHAVSACEEKWRVYDDHEANLPRSSTLHSLIDKTRRRHSLQNTKVHVISCFWPGKHRMSRILSRTTKLAIDFVLFEQEIKWLESYERSHSFHPPQDAVPEPLFAFSTFQKSEVNLEPLEDSEYLDNIKKLQSRLEIGEQDNSAVDIALATRTILLEPEALLFCSPRSHFTTLRTSDKGAKILDVLGEDICVGDHLLFSEGSDKSVISEIADNEYLIPDDRDIATQWRKDLIAYKEKRSLSFSDLQNSMKSVGITRHIATIRHWCDLESPMIAPSNHEIVIPKMLKLISPYISETDIEQMLIRIEKVTSAHIKAAKDLKSNLIEGLSEELSVCGSFSLQERIQQFEVLMITEENTELPYRILSKPQI